MNQPSAMLPDGKQPQQSQGQLEMRFCVHQLAARDELLLKSLVRLLSHRTHQRWLYTTEGAVDLVILGDGLHEVSTAYTQRFGLQARQGIAALTLDIGHTPKGQAHFLYLPLHANALEQMLNQLGRLAAARRQETSATQLFPGAPTVAVAVAVAVPRIPQFTPGDTFRLLRWPPTVLLTTAVHRKLATLMAGRAQTLDTLQQRSSMDRSACEKFLKDLQRLQLLEVTPNAAALPGSLPQPPLASSLPKVPGTAAGLPPSGASPVHWKASLSLVARIRSRLGLSSTASHL